MIATIVSGEVDLADLFFLVAVILAAVLTVVAIMDRAISLALVGCVLGFGFLGLLVL